MELLQEFSDCMWGALKSAWQIINSTNVFAVNSSSVIIIIIIIINNQTLKVFTLDPIDSRNATLMVWQLGSCVTSGKLPPLSEPAFICLQNASCNTTYNGASRLLGFINER